MAKKLNFLNKIFCKHEYEYSHENRYYDVIPGPGSYKAHQVIEMYYECKKCGKIKRVIF